MTSFCKNFVLFAFTALIVYPKFLSAIDIDLLTKAQSLTVLTGPSSQNSIESDLSILGGTRSLTIQNFSANPVFTSLGLGKLVYGEVDGMGAVILTYDGDTNPDTFNIVSNPAGLGGMDFTADGSNKIELNITFFDYPFSTAMPIKIRVYDASDTTGNKWSDLTVNVNQVVNSGSGNLVVDFPFSNFPTAAGPDRGPMGPADFTNVGAIQLTINRLSVSNDLIINYINTNGNCPSTFVPQIGQQLVDQCGVCGGNDQDLDVCDICTNSTPDIPTGKSAPNHDPAYVPDSYCLDCLGVPKGTALPGTTCTTGLFGICSPGKFEKDCSCKQNNTPTTEICNNQDDDCDGFIDEDVVDRCGVCGGDGTSCLGCNSFDQTDELRAMDGGAKRQERAIRNAAHRMTPSLQKGSREFKYLIKVMKQAHELQVRNWTISWQLPRISTQCTNATFCVNTTTTAIKDEYKLHNQELYDLFRDVFARLVEFRGGRAQRSDLKLNKHARRLYNENLARSNNIPDNQSVCN